MGTQDVWGSPRQTHPPETQLKGGSLKGLSEATLLRDVSRPPHLSISVITSSPAGFEADPAPRPGRRRCGGGDGEGDAGNALINNFIFETGRTAVAEIDVARPAGRSTRSEEHKAELQSLKRITYDAFCLKTNTTHINTLKSTI